MGQQESGRFGARPFATPRHRGSLQLPPWPRPAVTTRVRKIPREQTAHARRTARARYSGGEWARWPEGKPRLRPDGACALGRPEGTRSPAAPTVEPVSSARIAGRAPAAPWPALRVSQRAQQRSLGPSPWSTLGLHRGTSGDSAGEARAASTSQPPRPWSLRYAARRAPLGGVTTIMSAP